jgi:hypothetical protein
MSNRRHRTALLTVVAGLGVLAFAGAPAQAGQMRLFHGNFGCATGPGCKTPDPYPLVGSTSVAVDESAGPSRGDVYVSDAGNDRVEKFDSSGHLILTFGKAVNKTKVEEGKPEAEQNVCLAAEVCQPGTAAPTPGAIHGAAPEDARLFLAVDSSGGLSAGDVYVAETSFYGGGSLDVVTKFDEEGHLVSSWASAGQLDGSSIPEGPFADLTGIAVDSSGNLWVMDNPDNPGHFAGPIRASEFNQDASLITSWRSTVTPNGENSAALISGLAIDSSDHLYIHEYDGYLAEWSSSGARIGAITSPFTNPDTGELFTGQGSQFEPSAVAIDQGTGDIYQAGPFPAFGGSSSSPIVRRFAAASCQPAANEHLCSTAEYFGAGRVPNGQEGLAVDSTTPSDTVYAAVGGFTSLHANEVVSFAVETVPDVLTAKASGFTGATARLNGTVNPSGEPLTECFFEWAEGEKPYEHDAPCEAPDAAGVGSGSSPVEVHAQITGFTASKTYHFRLVASNTNTDTAEEPSRGQDLTFGPPVLLSASALDVSATSATLQAELGPNNLETTYHVEYDTVPYTAGEGPHGTSVPIPDADIGSGAATVTRNTLVEGLAPSTVYHYRIVATNTLGTVIGPERVITTQPAISGSLLLDGRGWEMVSPPEKSGSTISGIEHSPQGAIQASPDGDGIAFIANGAFGQEAAGDRSFQSSQFLATRGASGWSTKDITPPHEDIVGVLAGNTSGYKVFSQDLSLGALEPHGTTPLSPQASAPTPYLRAANGEYVPLVDAGNVPPEEAFDGKVAGSGLVQQEPRIEGGSPDLKSVVLASCFKLTEDAVNSCGKGITSLYVWREGALQLASVLPNEHPTVATTEGESELGAGPSEVHVTRHAVSEDGTRLVFTTVSGHHLYLRDLALPKTVQLDLPEPHAAGGAASPRFEDMSADGSKVFFTDTARLTTNSDADQSHPDLYMCEITVREEALGCALKDLSVAVNPGEAGDVLGASLGMDSSGRYVYFVANGALVPGATPGDCKENPDTGMCGLYLYDTVAGTVKLVTTLSGADFPDWAAASIGYDLSELTARVSPNGQWLAFMSQRPLTGYDNRDAVSGKPDEEVYLYDRLGDGGEGKLVCASCDPTGARPHGLEMVVNGQKLLNGVGTWNGAWLAAAIPGWTPFSLAQTAYQSRYLSNTGRLFFNSVDALVPQDSNGTTDVYEYEPSMGEEEPSGDTCTESSPTFGRASGGCVNLISSGTSKEESAFLDASENGDDVFFLTAARLSSKDVDTSFDIYDARVGGGELEPVPPPACEGDACQSPVGAPEDPTPASLTFSGPGNLVPALTPPPKVTKKTVKCKKGLVKKKVKKKETCVKKPKKRAKKPSHRKGSH